MFPPADYTVDELVPILEHETSEGGVRPGHQARLVGINRSLAARRLSRSELAERYFECRMQIVLMKSLMRREPPIYTY